MKEEQSIGRTFKMRIGGSGGSNTQTGQVFEEAISLRKFLLSKGMEVREYEVYKEERCIGYLVEKHKFYREFLERIMQINWRPLISSKILPDEAYFSRTKNRLIIIEKKSQRVAGSTDEKLQTCDFKKKQYEKLCSGIEGLEVEYVYVLNDWFNRKGYKDVLDYIRSVGCRYYFNRLPYELLGIED